ncbi:hypothetical protein FQR65_LT04655 [Abscondita terminalis]|nr:hypothetical protein FQR65_LT04655 [Abscondita terminalis]
MEDFSKKHEKSPNPKINANLFSLLTFGYTIPTYLKSMRIAFTEDDMYETLPEHCADNLGTFALKLWTRRLENCPENKKNSLLIKILMKLFARDYLISFALLIVVEVGAKIYMAIALGNFIESYGNEDRQTIYINASLIIICAFIYLTISHQYFLMCASSGLKMQVVCATLMYDKILKLNKKALTQTTSGQIINLLSNDLNPFENFFNTTHYLGVVPLQTIIVMYLTYNEIGISSAIGASLIFLFIPLHYLSAKLIAKYRTKTFVSRDERIRLMNEIIQGITTIKMYAWEKSFAPIIALYRKLEISSIRKCLYLKGTLSTHNIFITTSLFVTVMSTAFFNTTLSAKSAFIIATLYYIFGINFMLYIPQGSASLQECRISFQRITTFLLSDEVQLNDYSINTEYAVSIVNGSAKWNEHSDYFTLSKISCNIKFNSLTAIIGAVGSGKSSLFYVILQELPLLEGSLNVNSALSYCSQEPWIFSASVRNNILFGNKFDEERYKKVIKCCALELDLKTFSYGDKTIVGERGALISGGQKARINLARAVYREADIYLLDDPLSAVDTHVSKQIFENCIQTFLKNKTVIFITHQLQLLKYADHVIALENGEVAVEGCPLDLEKTGFNFVKHHEKFDEETTETIDKSRKAHFHDDVCSNKHLKVKSESQSHSEYHSQRKLNIYIYSGITILTIGATITRVIIFVNLSMKSSEVLHNSIFKKVLHASLTFFNNNSSGRILNRFSKDLGTMDDILPNTALVAFRSLLSVSGVLLVICVVDPWFIIPTAVVLVIIYFMRKVYLLTNLSVIRVESNARSPIYGHANTSVQGLVTIRAHKVQQILSKEFNTFLDERSSVYFLYLTMSRSFAFFVDVICYLRKKISIIPQDPVLFSGTVRKNLDPFDEFDDNILWKAVEEVKLKEVIHGMGSGLNSAISQNGSNLSVGQRQLICLARAIIRNNKILILDEATANVDLKTDVIIQETIRNNFINCTVLTIAHRLNTILDSDKVLVIDHGQVVEFDQPRVLLQNKQGFFYAMVQHSEESISKTALEIKENV